MTSAASWHRRRPRRAARAARRRPARARLRLGLGFDRRLGRSRGLAGLLSVVRLSCAAASRAAALGSPWPPPAAIAASSIAAAVGTDGNRLHLLRLGPVSMRRLMRGVDRARAQLDGARRDFRSRRPVPDAETTCFTGSVSCRSSTVASALSSALASASARGCTFAGPSGALMVGDVARAADAAAMSEAPADAARGHDARCRDGVPGTHEAGKRRAGGRAAPAGSPSAP